MIISLLSRSIINPNDLISRGFSIIFLIFGGILYLLKIFLLAFWYFQLTCNRKDANKKSLREIFVSVHNYLCLISWKKPTRRFINLQIDLALVYYNVHVFQTNRNNESINLPKGSQLLQFSLRRYQETLAEMCRYRWSI